MYQHVLKIYTPSTVNTEGQTRWNCVVNPRCWWVHMDHDGNPFPLPSSLLPFPSFAYLCLHLPFRLSLPLPLSIPLLYPFFLIFPPLPMPSLSTSRWIWPVNWNFCKWPYAASWPHVGRINSPPLKFLYIKTYYADEENFTQNKLHIPSDYG